MKLTMTVHDTSSCCGAELSCGDVDERNVIKASATDQVFLLHFLLPAAMMIAITMLWSMVVTETVVVVMVFSSVGYSGSQQLSAEHKLLSAMVSIEC